MNEDDSDIARGHFEALAGHEQRRIDVTLPNLHMRQGGLAHVAA